MFGTPDMYEEKNIDSVIRYICPLEGTEQVNVPVSPESKLIGSPTTQKRNDVGSRTRVRHPADDADSRCSGMAKVPHQWVKCIGCDRPAPRDVSQ